MNGRAASLVALGLVLGGCGAAIDAPPFRRLYPENRLGAVESVMARIGRPEQGHPTNATSRPLVVVATATTVVAYDVEARRPLWTADVDTRSRPTIAGEVVVVAAERDVVALDARDGHERWRVPVEENFLGAASSAERAFVVFGASRVRDGDRTAGALLCLDLANGEEIWRVDADRLLGAPAVAGDLVFVPWGGSYLSAFATANGGETMRLRSDDDRVTWVEARPEGVFYGSNDGVYRLTFRAAAGTRDGQTRFTLPQPIPLPTPVPTGRDAFSAAGAQPVDGLRLYWQPGTSDLADLPLVSESVYLVTPRAAFGLGHEDGFVRFARILDHPPVAGAATATGLLLVDARGVLVLLPENDGTPQELGTVAPAPVLAASFDLGAFAPAASPSGEPPVPLRTQLQAVAADADATLDDLSFRRWAVDVLATLEDPIATADLVALTSRADLPASIHAAALRGLRNRATGTEPLLEELRKRSDWIAGTEAGPVAALAHALAQAHEVAAVPLLLEHLDDPASDDARLAAVAGALGALGDEAAIEPLFTFLQRYHADPALGYRPDSLREAAHALLLLAGDDTRARLEAIAGDPHALAFIRDVIGEMLQASAAPAAN